jgi:hypothetical protein
VCEGEFYAVGEDSFWLIIIFFIREIVNILNLITNFAMN